MTDSAKLIAEAREYADDGSCWDQKLVTRLADALEAADKRERAVQKLHSRFGVYDECGHPAVEGVPCDTAEAHEGNEPVDIDDIGWTCEEGLIFVVCRECHTNEGDTTEDTEYGAYPCATLKALGIESTEP